MCYTVILRNAEKILLDERNTYLLQAYNSYQNVCLYSHDNMH